MPARPSWATSWHAPGQPSEAPQRPVSRRIFRRLKTLGLILLALAISTACVTGRLAMPNLGNPSETGPEPASRNLPEKQLLLDLINQERTRAGAPPVTLGNSPVPQKHAEDMLENCFISHWGTDGLKPYMRHSLAGSLAPNGENVYSRNECGHVDTWFIWTTNIEDTIRQANDGLYKSPGHRLTMLDPTYTTVNIGLAWNWTTFKLVQHFEASPPAQAGQPEIRDGHLRLNAALPPAAAAPNWVPIVLLVYDPPPRHLHPEQLAQTYCYDEGTPVGAIQGSHDNRASVEVRAGLLPGGQCPDPSQARRIDGRTTFTREHYLLHESAKAHAAKQTTELTRIAVHTVSRPVITDGRVSINADISETLQQHGPGVYTVHLILADPEHTGDHHRLVQHSIFHETPLSRAQLRWSTRQ